MNIISNLLGSLADCLFTTNRSWWTQITKPPFGRPPLPDYPCPFCSAVVDHTDPGPTNISLSKLGTLSDLRGRGSLHPLIPTGRQEGRKVSQSWKIVRLIPYQNLDDIYYFSILGFWYTFFGHLGQPPIHHTNHVIPRDWLDADRQQGLSFKLINSERGTALISHRSIISDGRRYYVKSLNLNTLWSGNTARDWCQLSVGLQLHWCRIETHFASPTSIPPSIRCSSPPQLKFLLGSCWSIASRRFGPFRPFITPTPSRRVWHNWNWLVSV